LVILVCVNISGCNSPRKPRLLFTGKTFGVRSGSYLILKRYYYNTTIEQALERARTKAGNKGWDAALSVIEMVDLFGQI